MSLRRIALFVLFAAVGISSAFAQEKTMRVLLVTGGHDFDRENLTKMILDRPNTTLTEITLPAEQDRLRAGIKNEFDAVIFHDQSRFELTAEQKANLEAMWAEGVPTVMLHHALISHNDFPLFREVFGTAFLIDVNRIDGQDCPLSTYKHPTELNFRVVDKNHPVTKGLADFTLVDEVFGNLWLADGNHVLIETDHPESSRPIVWTRQYKKSPVFVMIQGHDGTAFNDPRYREIFYRGLDWLAEQAAADASVSEPVAVRTAGDDGVAIYRIPGLVKTVAGTLVAVFDLRHDNANDLPENIDVGSSRSTDGGKTWSPSSVVFDFHGESEKLEGVGDPSILVDSKNGRIWCAALWAHNGKSIGQSEMGLIDGRSGRLVLAYSDDDGKTWSEPRDITPQFSEAGKEWKILFQGPGAGMTMNDGTLVFPAQFWDKNGVCHSTLITSADRGETWNVGTGAREKTSEAQVVELPDGKLMLNMRSEKQDKFRAVAVTGDFGQTWDEVAECQKNLPEPVCQASLIRVASKLSGDDADVLAFCNPKNSFERRDMTVQLSFDNGKTWSHSILIDAKPCWGYSSMAMVDAETIGVLYETNGGLLFRTVKWREIPKNAPLPADEANSKK